MKLTLTATRVALLAALFLGLFAGHASAQGRQTFPIPGVDIIVRKKPGGNAMRVTPGQTGTFVFEHLAAGQYTLSVEPPPSQTQNKNIVNTTRSNIKHPITTVVGGVQVVTVTVQAGTQPASTDIDITAAQGKITGTVTSAPIAAEPKPAAPK